MTLPGGIRGPSNEHGGAVFARETLGKPDRALPAGATDCHGHVFGPFDRFPLVAERNYLPPELPVERYLDMLDYIGFSRGVLVQPTAHGTDCRALLHALDLGCGRLRGTAVITPDVSEKELVGMQQRGIRGARFSHMPEKSFHGMVDFDALEQLAPRLARLGWHAQVFTSCDHLVEVAPRLTSLGLPLVIDHMGMFDIDRGTADRSFQALLRLLGEGNVWLKLTACRLSRLDPDYDDLAPFHAALVSANPERLIWGSDWPHVGMSTGKPEVSHLVDLFDRWTSNETLRHRILVDNPATLFGF